MSTHHHRVLTDFNCKRNAVLHIYLLQRRRSDDDVHIVGSVVLPEHTQARAAEEQVGVIDDVVREGQPLQRGEAVLPWAGGEEVQPVKLDRGGAVEVPSPRFS